MRVKKLKKENQFKLYSNSLFRCIICGRFAIAEELDLHRCKGLKQHKVEGDIMWGFDGEQWYPLKEKEMRITEHDREEYRKGLDRT